MGTKKTIVVICLLGLFVNMLMIPAMLFAEQIANETSDKLYKTQSMENVKKDKQKEKPIAVLEWDKVWEDLWANEGKTLKEKGLTEKEIIVKLDPVASLRVSEKLNMLPVEVKKIVDAYYTAYYAELEKEKKEKSR